MPLLTKLRLFCFALAISLAGFVSLASAQQAPPKPAAPPPDRAELEKKFAETMSGAVMTGSFTTTGQGKELALKQEKYTLGEVSKLRDDYWLFNVRIQYGDHDATLPLPLEVKWAGDTPVITLTKQPVPGFGTFTARVLIYDGHYAGFWSGGDHGGHLIGTIGKPNGDAEKKNTEKKDAARPTNGSR